MPEVGLGAALERFELVARGDLCCTIDIVDSQTASIVLPSLPEFPLEIDALRARQFVAAWRERNNIQSQSYEVHEEEREI